MALPLHELVLIMTDSMGFIQRWLMANSEQPVVVQLEESVRQLPKIKGIVKQLHDCFMGTYLHYLSKTPGGTEFTFEQELIKVKGECADVLPV